MNEKVRKLTVEDFLRPLNTALKLIKEDGKGNVS